MYIIIYDLWGSLWYHLQDVWSSIWFGLIYVFQGYKNIEILYMVIVFLEGFLLLFLSSFLLLFTTISGWTFLFLFLQTENYLKTEPFAPSSWSSIIILCNTISCSRLMSFSLFNPLNVSPGNGQFGSDCAKPIESEYIIQNVLIYITACFHSSVG